MKEREEADFKATKQVASMVSPYTIMSKKLSVLAIGGLVLLLVGLVVTWLAFGEYHKARLELVIEEQRSDTVYGRFSINIHDQIEVHWIHSVELTPWIEVYQVLDDFGLQLIETRFKSYGAGVPHQLEGTVSNQDGYTVITDLSQKISQFRWIHSHNAEFTLFINGRRIMSPEDLPHFTQMQFYIEKR
ncbi:DUF1850 domain-containing protein [Anaerobacillus sp. CMMVII]|uniref:DUF1850 domain-containing protein n=1 Tax=Anaerobacillus sp. CMMVII TaxID=2755588 RepID=UPI0021B7BE3B|nr:DUF1850 domain-containing protein [Anaerobacillus sp. CMMVII]MCT8139346.1 DUF1850 domain-containing protein [Anaerobacillus sp. CMMVII]